MLPTKIPEKVAAKKPPLFGISANKIAIPAEVIAETRSSRLVSKGRTIAEKVKGIAKSNEKLAGMVLPSIIPI